jgi:hypothetical protein
MADDQLGAGDESDHLASWEESLADGRQPPR